MKHEFSVEVKELLSRLVICLIDDSRAFTAGVGDLLRPFGCQVHSYNDPKLAIAQIPENKPDIIITDSEMGDYSGLDLIRDLRANTTLLTVPILMLTGKEEAEILVLVMLGGADAFVNKSNVSDALVATLVALARVRMLHQETVRLKQFTAIKAVIGTYKHEFGNIVAIIDGNIRRLERSHDFLSTDVCFITITKTLTRMQETLKKIDTLKDYQEEPYSKNVPIVKIS